MREEMDEREREVDKSDSITILLAVGWSPEVYFEQPLKDSQEK